MYIRMQERKKREKFEKLRNNPHNRQLFDEHLAQLPPSAIQEDSCCEVYSREFSKLMEPTKWLYRKSESYWEDKEKGDIRKKCVIIPRCCDLIACKLPIGIFMLLNCCFVCVGAPIQTCRFYSNKSIPDKRAPLLDATEPSVAPSNVRMEA